MKFRKDINGLRSCDLFHFNASLMFGGFSVASGFLMTGIIFKSLE
jgi:hypothetical protein